MDWIHPRFELDWVSKYKVMDWVGLGLEKNGPMDICAVDTMRVLLMSSEANPHAT